MEATTAPKDERWLARKGEIPRLVDSAFAKYAPRARSSSQPEAESATEPKVEPKPEPKPDSKPKSGGYTIDDVVAVFQKWLVLPTPTPIYAALGTVTANLLPGDPVWLGLVAPPSSAKTEILNSILRLANVHEAATLTPAALLSGTPKKNQSAGARGGLLRQVGSFGILLLKDFGSILDMKPDAKAETLAALREVFDGSWTRHVGSEGGRTLAWKGKVGLLFGATGVIDAHYGVIGRMGDRYLLCRMKPGEGQLKRAYLHAGGASATMRKELSDAVVKLFASSRREPKPLGEDELDQLEETCALVVRLRGAVDRDRINREVQAIYGAEGTARIGLCLERLLAGLDALGMDRQRALAVVKSVAMDSVPPLRRACYEYLQEHEAEFFPADDDHTDDGTAGGDAEKEEAKPAGKNSTPRIASELGLPTNTVRRALEDLAAYGLVRRLKGGKGKSDQWLPR
jgi:hypothetical protein